MSDSERLWKLCAETIRSQVPEATWRSCFEPVSPVSVGDDVLVLAVPSTLVKERLDGRYLSLVKDAVAAVAGAELDIQVEVVPVDADDDDLEADILPITRPSQAATPTDANTDASTDPSRRDMPLNPKYTFDHFVMGASNRFAASAALSVAESPARSYNPLFIHGEAGLGKTHLLQAIGHYVREHFPTNHVRYVSTETMMNEFVDAIRTNTTIAFKRRYRECDVLLVDDVQFLETTQKLQEEFFHTFNHIHQGGGQIVLTSDRHAKALTTLEDRLRSRFLMGLITEVQPPELETRLAILRKKAEGARTFVPDEVLEVIASHVKNNIRELEGALIRVSAYASLNGEKVNLQLTERVLADIFSADEPRPITPELILNATAETFKLTIEELCGPSRTRPLVTARQICMYVFRELTDFSYPAIGRQFGGRDHTTVIHAVDKISRMMGEKRAIYEQVSELLTKIKSGE